MILFYQIPLYFVEKKSVICFETNIHFYDELYFQGTKSYFFVPYQFQEDKLQKNQENKSLTRTNP